MAELKKAQGWIFDTLFVGFEDYDMMFHNVLYGDAKGWARRFNNSINSYIPGVMNPHAKVVQEWNKFFVISCLGAIFVDPLFFILLSVKQEEKCIVINWGMAKAIVFLRCLIDAIFLLNILLQFRLAYVAPESRVVGAGEIGVESIVRGVKKKSVLNPAEDVKIYMSLCNFNPGEHKDDYGPYTQVSSSKSVSDCMKYGGFHIWRYITLLLLLLKEFHSNGAIYAKNLLQTVILVQYIPRLFRFIPLLIGPNGFIFETALANFFINLFTFVLSGHIIGLCWYLFGLQRLIHCLHHACHNSSYKNDCMKFMDYGGHENFVVQNGSNPNRNSWKANPSANACFTSDGFSYGIYTQAVNLTGENIIIRYTYSLVWGIQQISTLAGNQTPSYFLPEILFIMAIIGIGLLLFAFLIGNMQNFLQALGRRYNLLLKLSFLKYHAKTLGWDVIFF
ncbi:hypothetical protein OIU78_029447 [Salix suchowensis]|nr:hypothetical protein OIU78_029447 [Salix suchowensis]